MDPLAPATHTLSPAISHIAETAASLKSSMHALPPRPAGLGIEVRVEGQDAASDAAKRRKKEQETVRWVLDTPRRLRVLLEEDKAEEAERMWEEVSQILGKWNHVAGVEELKLACEALMHEEDGSE
jgi:hypothetical protein